MNQKSKQKTWMSVLIALNALILSACVQVSDPDLGSDAQENVEQTAELSEYRVIPGEPNSYDIKVRLPEGVQVVQKENAQTKSRVNLVLKIENGYLVDESVQSGSTQIYHMGVVQNGNFQIVRSLEVAVPQDLLVSSPISLKQDTNWSAYNRIFLQALITTNGYRLQISTNEFYSMGALIQTFPVGTKAIDGKVGRNGGVIRIEAKKAEGLLTMMMTGEGGGKASFGVAGGNGGSSGHFFISVAQPGDFQIQAQIRGGSGGGAFSVTIPQGVISSSAGKAGNKEVSRFSNPERTQYY